MKRFFLGLTASSVIALLAAGCGGGAAAPAATPAATTAAATATATRAAATPTATPTPTGPIAMTITAIEDGDKYSWDPAPTTLKTGEYNVKFVNKAGNVRPHLLAVNLPNGTELIRGERAAAGQSLDMKFTLAEPGSYVFLCTIQGHADRGHKYTVNVTKG